MLLPPTNEVAFGKWLEQIGGTKELFGCPIHEPRTPELVKEEWENGLLTRSAYLFRETDHGFKPMLEQNGSKDAFVADDTDTSTGMVAHQSKSTNVLFADGHAKKKGIAVHAGPAVSVDDFWDDLEDN